MKKADHTPDTFVDDVGNFYKPFQDVRSAREAAFYQAVWPVPLRCELPPALQRQQGSEEGAAEREHAEVLQGRWGHGEAYGTQQAVPDPRDMEGLRAFVPKYCGLVFLHGRKYLVLKDVCSQYQQPCVLDVKMGFKSHYEWADEKYKAKCRLKDETTLQPSLGFRVCGLQVYQPATDQMHRKDRAWCKTITKERVGEPFHIFAGGGLSAQSLYHDPDHGVLSQLRKVRAWFEAQRSMQFFQASLLFTYEGTARSAAEANVQVHMIDFAHTFPSIGHRDDNVLLGLLSLISILEKC